MTIESQALLDALPEAVALIDERGRIELFNRAAERLFGYSAADVIGAEINQLIPTKAAEPRNASVFRGSEREAQARRKDGVVFSVLVSVERIVNTEPARFVCSIRTVDDAHHLHTRIMQVSRLATMGEMAAGIAHELNQPLTAIANYAQAGKWLLESQPPDLAEINDTLQEITTQALRAGGIILRLRGLIQKGEMRREPVRLDEVFNDIQGLISTQCRLQSVKLDLQVEPNLPRVNVDRVQIQQVLLILVRNAIEALEALPREQRTIHIHSSMRIDGEVEMSVADSGPGVALEVRDRLFHPFCTTKPEGVGLGLAIARTIVDAHDGTLGYRPENAGGARFFFSIPAVQAARGT